MDFVTPELAVGSRADAQNALVLAEQGIDAVLSLVPVPRPLGVARQLSLEIQDRAPLPGQVIAEAMEFLHEQRRRCRRALIHCEMGISRSPAIAAGYLHETLGIPVDEAIALVREARPLADPHAVLVASLHAHYSDEAGKEIDLSGNENPFGPSPRAMEAIRNCAAGLHRYPDKEAAQLRGKLASLLGVDGSQIMLGNGSCELIDLVCRACLGSGDEVLIPQPAFPAYRSAVRRAGATAVDVSLPGGAYRVGDILGRVTDATRMVVIGSPHNPTGTVLGPAQFKQLLDFLPAHVWVLIDEAYREYALREEMADALSQVTLGRKVVVLRSLSKAHGLAGLRVGYGVAQPDLAAAVERLCQQYNLGSLAQAAAMAALDDDVHLARTVSGNSREREWLAAGLSRLGLEHLPSAGNFILVRAGDAVAAALEGRGVKVKPMERYGAPGHFRVSVGLPQENARFLAALAEALAEAQVIERMNFA